MSQQRHNLERFVRTLALLIAVITFAGCIVPRREAFGSHRLKERLPKEAWEITKGQLEHLVGSHDVRGVPILDPSVDWGEPKNWPTRFQFRGETFASGFWLNIGSDHLQQPKSSRAQLPLRGPFYCQYTPADGQYGNSKHLHTIIGEWNADESVSRIEVRSRATSVEYRFRAKGSLSLFRWRDWQSNTARSHYYDTSGQLRGFKDDSSGDINTQPVYEWDGKAVDFETFEKLSGSIKLD